MTTRQDLRNLVRRRLGDDAAPFEWSDLQLNQWINDAIAEHSVHFPRRTETAISCTDDVRVYDLPNNFRAALSVEYPLGEDPPLYLARRSYTQPGFWTQGEYYDIVQREDGSEASEVWISAKPDSGESIAVSCLVDHAYLDDDPDTCTIPDRHLELIVLFVRWTCYQELASTESADPDPTNLALGTLELNAYRAKREYRIKLAQWQEAEAHSANIEWRMDKWDRVY